MRLFKRATDQNDTTLKKLASSSSKHSTPTENARKFDLNIEEVLEGWEIHHAIREIIANALDEKILTNTAEIEVIQNSKNECSIRDWGRGLMPEHLTQNENAEKMSSKSHVIGRFGVGLKDALAVLNRRGVQTNIRSRYCSITTESAEKHGFEEITTLHAIIESPNDPNMIGTEIILSGVPHKEVDKAKSLFRRFSDETKLESTKYGDILDHTNSESGRIYINGILVATEDTFLFSYDITSLTTNMKRMLNRERTNVGRAAYTDRVKSILMQATELVVIRRLADDMAMYETGNSHDEVKWNDVAVRACKILNTSGTVVFATAYQQRQMTDIVDKSRRAGMRIVTVPDTVSMKLSGTVDESGDAMRDIQQYTFELNEQFEFKFVDADDLSPSEKRIWDSTYILLELAGANHLACNIRISETMRPGRLDVDGIYEANKRMIVIKRSRLFSLESYADVLLHEVAHALSGEKDITRGFELELSRLLGRVASRAVSS